MQNKNLKNALIIGGSSGLGLALAQQLKKTHNVYATGRRLPDNVSGITFFKLGLSDTKNLGKEIESILTKIKDVDLLIYAAGYYQGKLLGEVTDSEIHEMINVGITAPALIIKHILDYQHCLQNFIAITSTSQWTPRRIEPLYTAGKAGLGMLAQSLSLDESFEKVMVAGPAGMQTRFWENEPRDTATFNTMLKPEWVAEQILSEYADDFAYKFIKILREPARVEISEKR